MVEKIFDTINHEQHGGNVMKLNIGIGSVVTFFLSCTSNIDTTGKVISIDDNEVVILNQGLVANCEYDERWGCSDNQVDHTCTVSIGNPIHIDRQMIIGWSYYSVPVSPRSTYYGIFRPSDLERIDSGHISHYVDGVCRGNAE